MQLNDSFTDNALAPYWKCHVYKIGLSQSLKFFEFGRNSNFEKLRLYCESIHTSKDKMKTKGILQFTYSKTFLLCKTVYLILTFLFVACESFRNSFLKVIIFIWKEMNFYLPKETSFLYVNIGFFGLWITAAVSFHINWTQPVTSFKSFKFKLPVKIKTDDHFYSI